MLYPDYTFSENFCTNITNECSALVDTATSFNLVAASGVGVTFFVKYLERQTDATFVYVNPYEMHEITQEAVYAQLARKLDVDVQSNLDEMRQALNKKLEHVSTIVLLFNRFDRVRNVVGDQFYDHIRYLRDINRARVVVAFVTTEPLVESVSAEASEFMSLVNRTVYFGGYGNEDMQELLAAGGSRRATDAELRLAGGHHLLLQVVMGCQDVDNALSDPMVELLVHDLVMGLSPRRRKLLAQCLGTSREVDDMCLLQTKFVHKEGVWRAFSPLVDEYVQRAQIKNLPLKEQRLFDLLLRHTGEVVGKQVIFDHVWAEDDGIATDWSLNALVYRLRRHAAFDQKRYEIVSHKKAGYALVDTHSV
jgi:hypothetical protein